MKIEIKDEEFAIIIQSLIVYETEFENATEITKLTTKLVSAKVRSEQRRKK